jgi:hypothetical protein
MVFGRPLELLTPANPQTQTNPDPDRNLDLCTARKTTVQLIEL